MTDDERVNQVPMPMAQTRCRRRNNPGRRTPRLSTGWSDAHLIQGYLMKRVGAASTVPPTRVLVVDDHYAVRRSLIRLLDQQPSLTVSAAVASAERALDFVGRQPVDLAIVDISLPTMDGLELTRKLRRDHPTLPILILSMRDPAVYAQRALDAGASGFLAKQEASAAILTAIHQVLTGRTYVSPAQDTIH